MNCCIYKILCALYDYITHIVLMKIISKKYIIHYMSFSLIIILVVRTNIHFTSIAELKLQRLIFLISVPPRIHHVTSNGRLQVKMGSPVRLECAASGNPPPVITWSRKNNLLPSGNQYINLIIFIFLFMQLHSFLK